MGNKKEHPTTKKFVSSVVKPKNVDVIDLTQEDDDDAEGHSCENIKMKLTSYGNGSKPQSSMPDDLKYSQKPTTELANPEKSARTSIFYRKRKLSKGKEGSEEGKGNEDSTTQAIHVLDLNKKLSINETDEVDTQALDGLDLNKQLSISETDEVETTKALHGLDLSKQLSIHETDEVETTQALHGLDLNKQLSINDTNEVENPIAIKDIDLESLPEKKHKSRTSDEVDSFVVDINKDATAGDAKVSKIDLNEPSTEVDKNWY